MLRPTITQEATGCQNTKYTVRGRKQITVNTDPQRRCYDGCCISSELVWTEWQDICTYGSLADAEDSMATFARINPKREYCIIESDEGDPVLKEK